MMPNSESPLLPNQTLAAIVTSDSRAAAVLERRGLDYCCRGQQTLEQAARERGVALPDIVADLEALARIGTAVAPEVQKSDLDTVTRHIVGKHHQYVREITPVIFAWLDKLVARHGARHPELEDVRATFRTVAADLETHMAKEEHVLFPYIDALTVAARTGGLRPLASFGSVAEPIRVMERDHRQAGAETERLRSLTNNYQPPRDACTTYRLCYETLARFEADLHRHVHLENHLLFPRAVELERAL